jgi:hypothetical protein
MPARPAKPRRKIWNWGDHHDFVSLSAGEMAHSMVDENAICRIDVVGEKAGEGENPHAVY